MVYAPSCEELGKLAFENCTSLLGVYMPKCGVINDSAFVCCTSLTTLALPATKIGSSAFSYCVSLARLRIPNANIVGSSCFSRCANLKSIESKLLVSALAKGCNQDDCRKKKLCPECSGGMEVCLQRGQYQKYMDTL